ncbi:hypothetical protein [Bradyrhizobium pachyrhizi]|nr:hypothetical protein [Bradyrhizobium pachyrhizi]
MDDKNSASACTPRWGLFFGFAKPVPVPDIYLGGMPITRTPPEIPPDVGQQFADKMRQFHAEYSPLKRDEIAADTRHPVLEHMPKVLSYG